MTKTRGFEVVRDEHRTAYEDVTAYGKKTRIYADIILPARSDPRSAGYDLFLPRDVELLPAQKTLVWLDVKAYMGDTEVLEIYPRSSLGIKKGLMLSNTVGIIDASYYENPDNDGNIGLSLLNTSGRQIQLKRNDRVAQAIFKPYLLADEDVTLGDDRIGGIGSSGE